jgi:glutaredoxin 3
MKKVDIYTSSMCPYCHNAKALLSSKGVTFNELKIDGNTRLSAEAVQRSGGMRTVPQIFIENHHVGGYDDLNLLDQKGKLDPLLGIAK